MSKVGNLIDQIDAFIRKYYANQIIRGVLLFALIFVSSYLLVAALEFIGRFNSYVRAFLFFSFIVGNIFVLFRYIIIPISKLYSFGKRINRYQAAKIIGKFFPEVNDRLLNTLQLNDFSEVKTENIEFVKASVEQNANKLSVFSFSSAVDFNENKKYLKYILPTFITAFVLFIFVPNLFKEGTDRLINYNLEYVPPAPFSFELENDALKIEQGEDFTFSLRVVELDNDESIPNRVYLNSSAGKYLMERGDRNTYRYTLKKVQSDLDFSFSALGHKSSSFTLDVVGKSGLNNFSALITPPAYLGSEPQTINNPGDLVMAEGSEIIWNGRTRNTSSLDVITSDTTYRFDQEGFRVSRVISSSTEVSFVLHNRNINKSDTLVFAMDVIKDEYPEIFIEELVDSNKVNMRKLAGTVSDDHGVGAVSFYYEVVSEDGTVRKEVKRVPGISGISGRFSMIFNLNELGLKNSDRVSYYFVVSDNDGVNGAKSTSSRKLSYSAPSKDELNEQRNKSKDDAKKELDKLIEETKSFNERMDQFKMDLLNTTNPSFNEVQQLEQLNEQRKSLENKIENLSNELNKSFEQKEQFTEMDEELLEQQKLMEELLDNIMDDELKDLLEELQELMEKSELEGAQELIEEVEEKGEDREDQLDRTMEMLKEMDVDERVDQLEEALEDLANKQEDLQEKMEENEISDEKSQSEQDDINEKFDELNKELEELLEKNEDLKRPLELEGLEKDADEVKKDLKEAKESLESGEKKESSKSQKKASDKMKEMSSKLNSQKKKSKEKQAGEDMEALRRLLTNLVRQSLDQEIVLNNVVQSSTYGPEFNKYGREQRAIIDNNKIIEDSLRALADRIPKISSFITKELGVINKSYRNLIDDIDERRKRDLMIKQQTAMTSINNLALFLNESLENMQQEMQGDKEGEGECENPGGKGKGKKGSDMNGLKEQLKKQLEEMKKGSNPGGKKPGGKEGAIQLPFGNKQAAKMAAQQQAMKKMLQQMREELNKDGSGKGNQLNELLEELEKQQENLINKNWDSEMINRQKEILTKLLESEKALEERGWDEQRESISGKDEDFSNQIEFLEYKKEKQKQIELLRTVDPSFSKYYRDRANEYFKLVN
jgi:hypothetical protein